MLIFLCSTAFAGTWTTVGKWSTTPDEGKYEVFTTATEDYSSLPDVSQTIDSAANWRSYLSSTGYSNQRYGTDDLAWSTDWDTSTDNVNADAGDFGFMAHHGSSGTVYFNGTYGDSTLTASETKWGDGDNEAIAIQACQVLDSAGRSAFASANQNAGIHYIFGFETNALDSQDVGTYYGKYLYAGYDLSSAWKSATKVTHGSSYTGAQVRFASSSCDTSTDTAYATSCDPKSSSTYAFYTWTL